MTPLLTKPVIKTNTRLNIVPALSSVAHLLVVVYFSCQLEGFDLRQSPLSKNNDEIKAMAKRPRGAKVKMNTGGQVKGKLRFDLLSRSEKMHVIGELRQWNVLRDQPKSMIKAKRGVEGRGNRR